MTIKAERCRLVFRKLERDLDQLAAGQQAETVHRFRTSTRRLQTLIEELLPERTRKQKKLLKVLRGIRRKAGKLRDLDVQIAALRSLKAPLEPRRTTQLLEALIELRAEHERKLRKTFTKRATRAVRKQLKGMVKEIELRNSRDPLAAAREILSRAMPPARPVTEDTLHRCRLLVKRARYAAEFAPESAATKQFIAEIKRLQDILGNWHDWLTLTHTATERLGSVNESPLVAVLHNMTGAKLRNAVAAIAATPALQAGPKPVALAGSGQAGMKTARPTARKDAAA